MEVVHLGHIGTVGRTDPENDKTYPGDVPLWDILGRRWTVFGPKWRKRNRSWVPCRGAGGDRDGRWGGGLRMGVGLKSLRELMSLIEQIS